MRISNGKIMTARTIPPVSAEYPEDTTPKRGAKTWPTKGTMVKTPQTPYTMGGIPESRSIRGSSVDFKRWGAYSEIYTALIRDMGNPMVTAKKVTSREPDM